MDHPYRSPLSRGHFLLEGIYLDRSFLTNFNPKNIVFVEQICNGPQGLLL